MKRVPNYVEVSKGGLIEFVDNGGCVCPKTRKLCGDLMEVPLPGKPNCHVVPLFLGKSTQQSLIKTIHVGQKFL